MTAATSQESRRLRVEEYLELLEASDERLEFDDGKVVAMAGGSISHGRIGVNLGTALGREVKRPCEPFSADTQVHVPSRGRFFFTDGFVVCGDVELYEDNPRRGIVLNPRVIFEVTSPSSEGRDRGDKFDCYRDLPSFEEYLLIAQDRPQVQGFLRRGEGDDVEWSVRFWEGLDAVAQVRCLGIDLPLRELYARVDFGDD